MFPKSIILSLFLTSIPALGGQGGSHNAADSLDEYCFYTIYTTLSEYTFTGSTTISSSDGTLLRRWLLWRKVSWLD